MEDKYISKRYTGNIPGIKIYMNNKKALFCKNSVFFFKKKPNNRY